MSPGEEHKPADVIGLLSPERAELVRRRNRSATPQLWDLLDAVKDPEIPAVSLWDLGILQDIRSDDTGITVVITPTYSGCPAMDLMAEEIGTCLNSAGFSDVRIETRLTPAWSTDWLDSTAKEALRNYGIAPPSTTESSEAGEKVNCPHCGDSNTTVISEFGSTACKALYRCKVCGEPFDYFKPI